jgi:hypothetical protein
MIADPHHLAGERHRRPRELYNESVNINNVQMRCSASIIKAVQLRRKAAAGISSARSGCGHEAAVQLTHAGSLRRSYAELITSGAQLLLLFIGLKLESREAWLGCLSVMAIISFAARLSALKRLRAIRGTPTSSPSAAQVMSN